MLTMRPNAGTSAKLSEAKNWQKNTNRSFVVELLDLENNTTTVYDSINEAARRQHQCE